uniref:Uncharacterized protein n=1 Tax=Physcomitrium patens TaxID=3218 RepID=A0A2K1JPP8_PHYPA|nr:hypothetical protein PHYPA_015872 [Physcomitrium patens]
MILLADFGTDQIKNRNPYNMINIYNSSSRRNLISSTYGMVHSVRSS